MFEPSIIKALKASFNDSKTYYQTLHEFAQGKDSFFDKYMGGHIIVGYQACKDAYRTPTIFGRSRLNLPSSFFDGCDNQQIFRGYEVLTAMSIFLNVGETYAPRRQRLLAQLSRGKQALDSGKITQLAVQHMESIPHSNEIDLFELSLRRYASECATLALIGTTQVPFEITKDALLAAYFFDGKRVSRPHVLDALSAIDRLATWIAKQHNIDRITESDLIADLVLLYIASHESMAYLLYTCFKQLSYETDISRLYSPTIQRDFVQEAIRLDAPVQNSGRIALFDTQIGSTQIKAGDKVYLHVGAANHDPRAFDSPECFREQRENPHLAFGWGNTLCVGSEYATHCSITYINQALRLFSSVKYSNKKTIFDHGLSARGLKNAYFTFN